VLERRAIIVDIGNTRVKWAWIERGALKVGEPFSSRAETLKPHLDARWGSIARPDLVYVSNVAGSALGLKLADWIAARWRAELRLVRPTESGFGVTNGYERPDRLGVDRWVGLIALRRYFPGPACLADCGTALTLDALDAEGRHLGGVIAPGPALMKKSLAIETSAIREFDGGGFGALGRNTAEAVANGVAGACVGLVEKTVSELSARLGCAPCLVITGGGGSQLAAQLAIPSRLDPHLVLKGLLTIVETEL
jgi:type III pantothenate kinase